MLMDGVEILEKTPVYELSIFDLIVIVGILISVFFNCFIWRNWKN